MERQQAKPQSVFLSATSEVFAFSEAIKDARLLLWQAEEMGVDVKYAFKLQEKRPIGIHDNPVTFT